MTETVTEIVVVGSLNMDLVTYVDSMPKVGETQPGRDFRIIPGGKGGNQAVAAARLGVPVAMVGRVGQDVFGEQLVDSLVKNQIDISRVRRDPSSTTGTASIVVDAGGQNSIVIISGANGQCAPEDVDSARVLLETAKIVLLQMEIPLATVEYTACLAKSLGKLVILDPAPAQPLSRKLLNSIDIITPNESEAESLTGRKIPDIKSARLAAADLLGGGVKVVLMKLGAQGVLYAEGNKIEHVAGIAVDTVDTTAAGDAFNAGLAVALAESQPMHRAIRFANAVGALSTTRAGAQTSLPQRDETEQFISIHKIAF